MLMAKIFEGEKGKKFFKGRERIIQPFFCYRALGIIDHSEVLIERDIEGKTLSEYPTVYTTKIQPSFVSKEYLISCYRGMKTLEALPALNDLSLSAVYIFVNESLRFWRDEIFEVEISWIKRVVGEHRLNELLLLDPPRLEEVMQDLRIHKKDFLD